MELKSLYNFFFQLKDGKGADEPIKVKISGDGAKMSHTSTLFVFSFSLVDDGQSCLSSSGNFQIFINFYLTFACIHTPRAAVKGQDWE